MIRETFEQFLQWVEFELDQRDSIPSWTTPIHDRVTEAAQAAFQAGKTVIEAADEAETEAWRLWNLHV